MQDEDREQIVLAGLAQMTETSDQLAACLEDTRWAPAAFARPEDQEILARIDEASAALRRLGMLLFNAGDQTLAASDVRVLDAAAPQPLRDAAEARRASGVEGPLLNLSMALNFFRIGCERYRSTVCEGMPIDPADLRPGVLASALRILGELDEAVMTVERLCRSAGPAETGPRH